MRVTSTTADHHHTRTPTKVTAALTGSVDAYIADAVRRSDEKFFLVAHNGAVPPGDGAQIDQDHVLLEYKMGRSAALRLSDSPRNEALFHAADVDNDGLLNRTEFLWFRHPVIGPAVRDRHAKSFLKRFDRDGDGGVGVDEFVNGALQIKAEGRDKNSPQALDYRAEVDEWKREFTQEFDSDGDGVLTLAEVHALLAPNRSAHGIAEAYSLVLAADTNGDHELSPDEVRAAIRKFRSSSLLNFAKRAELDADRMVSDLVHRMLSHLSRQRHDEL
jgi:Ca2+-binding EF-hand superfamily protein